MIGRNDGISGWLGLSCKSLSKLIYGGCRHRSAIRFQRAKDSLAKGLIESRTLINFSFRSRFLFLALDRFRLVKATANLSGNSFLITLKWANDKLCLLMYTYFLQCFQKRNLYHLPVYGWHVRILLNLVFGASLLLLSTYMDARWFYYCAIIAVQSVNQCRRFRLHYNLSINHAIRGVINVRGAHTCYSKGRFYLLNSGYRLLHLCLPALIAIT